MQQLFSVLGECPEVNEDKLEAYAIITAMGPTYLWPQVHELHEPALDFGLTEQETIAGMKAMVANTMDLLYETGLSYEEVVDLIPVKPLGDHEAQFQDIYRTKLSSLFRGFIGAEATDLVKMPFGLDLPVGARHGASTVVVSDGVKMLEVPLWRSYLAGCIFLGIAPCTAMVMVRGYLARGNDGLTLVMVAINSLTMLVRICLRTSHWFPQKAE